MSRINEADTLRRQGESERRQPGGDGGLGAYQQVVAILRDENEPLRLAHAIRHLGDVHHERRELEAARGCYDEALALYRDHPEARPLDLANALRSMAVLQDETGGDGGALWREAWRLYETLGVAAGVAEARARMKRGTG